VVETREIRETREYQRRWWTLGVLCLSLVMIVVANTSLNVALPTLVKDLHAGSSGLQWIVDAYSLVFAGLLLTAGSLGDRYGRKHALNVGLIIFGAASAIAAYSGSTGLLIGARAAMGVGAALVMPATLSVLAHVFPPNERPRAIGIWAGFAGVGAASGSIISGFLLEHFWWGSIFLTNVGVVIVALIAGWFLVPSSKEERRPSLDPLGAVLSIAGLGTLIYAIIEAPNKGWATASTFLTFALAVAILGAFAAWELRASDPMLDLRFFRNPRFTAATSSITLIFFVMFGMIFLLTQYLQLVLGYSPLQAGVRIVPWALVYMTAAPLSARLVERWGQRRVVSGGFGLVAISLALLALSQPHSNYALLVLSFVIGASGMGMTTAPSTGAIMVSLPLDKAGVGSAVNDTTRELGGALGVAVLGSVLASRYRAGLSSQIAHLPAAAHGAGSSLGAALQASTALSRPEGAALATAARHSYVHAFDATMILGAGIALIASGVVSWLLRPARATAEQEAGLRLEAEVA
jgi:EmrB/QacA subfamily drug resistance transporter